MKYIHFVIISICLLVLCTSPAVAIRTGAMIHYSEPDVAVGDEIFLEQGYSFKVLDMNSKSNDIWIELYLNGEEIGIDDNFVGEDNPLEYVRSVVVDEDDDEEVDYFILRVTPEDSVEKSDGVTYSSISVEQYLDPVEEVNDHLILDDSYTFEDDSELELGGLYTLGVTDVDDDEVTLELRRDGKLLKEDEVEEDEYFYYTDYSDDGPQTIFLANVEAFFETDDSITVFLNHVSLQQGSISSSTEVPENVDLDVESPVGGELKAGNLAIISYYVGESFEEVRITVDGELIDSRNEVNPGTYKAVTEELDAGTHEATLMAIDDGDVSYYSEEFSVSANIKDNITESIVEITNSATESLGKDNNSSGISGNVSLLSLPSASHVSSLISLIVTAGVFFVFFMFFKKFR